MIRDCIVIKDEEGFTLLEVLVAFVILAGSLGLIYNFLISGVNRSEVSSGQMRAILIAESKMAESEMLPMYAEGDTEAFHWTLLKTPQNGNSQNDRRQPLKLNLIQVTLSWQSVGGKRDYKLESLRPARQ